MHTKYVNMNSFSDVTVLVHIVVEFYWFLSTSIKRRTL